MPAWMKAVDSVTPVRAAAIGFLLTCVNPKTLLLIIGGAAAAARTGTSASVLVVTWAVFVLIGSIGVATPVIIYFALGVRSEAILRKLKVWMVRHNSSIVTVLCVIVGATLIADGISGLSA